MHGQMELNKTNKPMTVALAVIICDLLVNFPIQIIEYVSQDFQKVCPSVYSIRPRFRMSLK